MVLSLNSTGPTRTRTPTPRRLLARILDARISSRGCPLGMRACTRVRVLYMINDKVRVGVGPMEFKLYRATKNACQRFEPTSPALQAAVPDGGYCCRCHDQAWSVCLSVCRTRPGALQKRPNRSRCRLGQMHVGPRNHLFEKLPPD